jgi:serine/threonine protein kinase
MNFEQPSLVEHGRKHFPGKHALEFGFEGRVSDRQSQYVKYLEQQVNNPENYIDEGGAGKVYALGEGKVCIKLMPERNPEDMVDAAGQLMHYDLGNSVRTEAWFLEELSGFRVEGVRSPSLVEYLEGPEYAAIVMEQLDAINLQHVLNRTEEFPETFDLEDFFDRLESYIYELHDSRQMLHGDLEPRNVMIDRKTGEPRIIDFGRAKYLPALPEEQRSTAEQKERKKFENIREKVTAFVKLH